VRGIVRTPRSRSHLRAKVEASIGRYKRVIWVPACGAAAANLEMHLDWRRLDVHDAMICVSR
jgi:hypothetical protein